MYNKRLKMILFSFYKINNDKKGFFSCSGEIMNKSKNGAHGQSLFSNLALEEKILATPVIETIL